MTDPIEKYLNKKPIATTATTTISEDDPIKKYLQPTTQTKTVTKTPTKAKETPKKTAGLTLKQRMAMENYKEPYSFGNKLKSDVGTFMTSIPKIPLALWDTAKSALAENGIYDKSKPLWGQQGTKEMQVKNAKMAALNMIPGYMPFEVLTHLPYMDKIPGFKNFQEATATPVSSMANKFALDSMIKNTGKWIYNPEAQTRRWFTPASDPTSRAQDYKDRPFSSALEDITNVSILGAPIVKATGIGAKVAGAVNKAKPLTEVGNPLLDLAGVSKAKRAMIDIARPAKYIEDKITTPLNQRSKLLDIVSEMKQKTFQRTEELKQGNLMQSLKGVSKENQPELQALIQKRASIIPDNILKTTKTAEQVASELNKNQPIFDRYIKSFKKKYAGDLEETGTMLNSGDWNLNKTGKSKFVTNAEGIGKVEINSLIHGRGGYGGFINREGIPKELWYSDSDKALGLKGIDDGNIGNFIENLAETNSGMQEGAITAKELTSLKNVNTVKDFTDYYSKFNPNKFNKTFSEDITLGNVKMGNIDERGLLNTDSVLKREIENDATKQYQTYSGEANKYLETHPNTSSAIYELEHPFVAQKGSLYDAYLKRDEILKNRDLLTSGENKTKPVYYPSDFLTKQNSLTNALKTYEKSATIESTSLIKRGLLKEGIQTNAAWKDLTTEFGKSIDEIKALGIDEPVYYPHTFEKYNVSGYAKLRSKKANYLKTKQGVTSVEGKGIEEPIVSIPKHKVEFIVQKTVGQALKQVTDTFGKPIVNGEILPGYSAWNPKQFNLEFYPIEGRAIGSQGALKPLVTVKKFAPKLQIPKFLNEEIIKMVTPVQGILKTVGAVWDKATNSWKISVLALSPRWVFNNVMGNTMLNTLAGVINPASYIEAGKRLIKGSKQAKTEGISFARAMSRQHIPEGAWEGLYRAEARSAAPGKGGSWLVNDTAPVTGMWKKLGYKLEAVPKAMYNFNSTIESFYRTAHYIDKIDAGLNPVKALASVNEFLFDYSKLSVMEKAVARRIVPFYAWQKNITRLLATYPFKHPVGFTVLAKLDKIAVEAQKSDESQDFMPEWFKSYMKTPIKNEQGQNLYASTRGINPFADIGALSGDAMSYLSGINPMLKIPLERALGMSLYKGKAFTSPTADIIGGNEKVNPPLWRHILSNFPQFTTAENIAKPYSKYDTGEPMLDKEGKLKSEKSRLLEALKLLGINLTPYNEDELKQTQIEQLMREATIKKSYAEKMRKFQQSQ